MARRLFCRCGGSFGSWVTQPAEKRYRDLLARATPVLEDKTWNGSYYRLYANDGQIDEGCLSDQIIGQWAMHLLAASALPQAGPRPLGPALHPSAPAAAATRAAKRPLRVRGLVGADERRARRSRRAGGIGRRLVRSSCRPVLSPAKLARARLDQLSLR